MGGCKACNNVRRSLGIAAVLALGSIVIANAQQQPAPPASAASTPPPTVTAPVARVPGQWPDVDCAAAKLTTTASQPRCRMGPTYNSFGREVEARTGCTIEQWNVATRSPSNFGYALLATPRTLVPRCVIGYWDIAALLKNYNPVAKTGTGWSDVNQIGGIYTASFTSAGGQTASVTSVGGENCRRS